MDLKKNKLTNKKKRCVEQLCAANPEVAAESSKIFRPTTMRMQIEEGCLDLLQIIVEIARPNSASSHDGKKQVVTVPGSLRKLQAIEPPSKHEDLDFTAASLKHI
ncbi:unnamed protein product [Rotaria magnacalcarata]|uniref:Uncharacterized protein n=1 Tax=Rotaria magnacalcarata TaxID=392030 RepID=A0A820A5L9_9BILA|nr:unnamed protein product [Rotaria magnacalcarata]CAF4176913.1 unnamed protein product [Rotaria magnacalcarata]